MTTTGHRCAPACVTLAACALAMSSCSSPPVPRNAPVPAARTDQRSAIPNPRSDGPRADIDAIARELIAASPVADDSDAAARDAAAARLGECKALLGATGDLVLWGGFHPAQGYDPEAYVLDQFDPLTPRYQLTELNPLVWTRLYLSTYMFPGPYEVRREGGVTVLDVEARFRKGMDAGEYPYPFWHSPNKWTAYVNTERVYFIFKHGRLIGGMRKSPPDASVPLAKKRWDGRWHWTDASGEPQPRVALYSYIFSKDNPYVAGLDASYRALESDLRAHVCTDCHAPNNMGHMNDLLLLNFPNQALAARDSILEVIDENRMPPGSKLAGEHAGIADPADRARLRELAKAFVDQADAAFEFEKTHKAKP